MKIAFVSQPEYFRFCYEQDLNDQPGFEFREFPFHFGMGESDFESLMQYKPDLTFFFRGEFANREVIRKLSGTKVAISSEPFPREINGKIEYTQDSLRRYLSFRSLIRELPYDYVFHYDESSIAYLSKDGLQLSGAFPFPVAIDSYTPATNSSFEWDLFFIGRSTDHRERFFGPLKHNFDFLHICHGIFGPPLVEYINKSKINLNVHAENEISWEPRLQMLLATGAFVISEPITPNNILRPGVDYIEARSPSEMLELTKYYLEHESERKLIAESGRARVAERLSARNNFMAIISGINEERFPKYYVGKALPLLNWIENYIKLRRKFTHLINR